MKLIDFTLLEINFNTNKDPPEPFNLEHCKTVVKMNVVRSPTFYHYDEKQGTLIMIKVKGD